MTACARAGSKQFVFGIVMVGAHDDHGWNEAHYEAGGYVEAQLPGAKMVYIDQVNPGNRRDTTLEQAVEALVSQGAQIIFVASDDLAADTDIVAAQYPKILFVHIGGDHVLTGEAPKNVANYMARMEYTEAVAGCAAALKTQTHKIGYLGPQVNAESRRFASAAYLGCRYCFERYRGGDPDDIKFVVNWIGYRSSIPGTTLDPTQASQDLFNSGVDVLLSGIDTMEAIVVAGQRAEQGDPVWAIPYNWDRACETEPAVCLGVPYFNWGPAYVRYVQAARDGKFRPSWEWSSPNWKDINDQDKSPVGFQFGPALDDQEKQKLEEYISLLSSKKADLFVGPLNLQDGSLYLRAGESASDQQNLVFAAAIGGHGRGRLRRPISVDARRMSRHTMAGSVGSPPSVLPLPHLPATYVAREPRPSAHMLLVGLWRRPDRPPPRPPPSARRRLDRASGIQRRASWPQNAHFPRRSH